MRRLSVYIALRQKVWKFSTVPGGIVNLLPKEGPEFLVSDAPPVTARSLIACTEFLANLKWRKLCVILAPEVLYLCVKIESRTSVTRVPESVKSLAL